MFAKKYGQITGWGKKLLKGDNKKGGKMYIFPQLVKSIHIFSPIALYIQIAKKRLQIFHLRHAPPPYNKFHLGKKYKSKRGEAKI